MMNPPLASPRTRPKKGHRSIVDPKKWDSVEVGGSEAKLGSASQARKAKVSSMRSSLFQKNKKAMVAGENVPETAQEGPEPGTLVFQLAMESDALRFPFSFEATNSVKMCDYGKVNKKVWTKDVFAVVHNGIRSELLDISTILKALQRLGGRLTIGDFMAVRPWVQVCLAIVLDFLDMEARVLIPWVGVIYQGSKAGGDDGKKVFQDLPKRQATLREIIVNISKVMTELCEGTGKSAAQTKPAERLSAAQRTLFLMGSLDALVTETCDHMQDQEDTFPQVLPAAYKRERRDGKAILGSIITHYAHMARKPDCALPLLTRWMQDLKAAKAFGKTVEEVHKCNYSTMHGQFEMNHGGFAQQLKIKVGLVEKEASSGTR